MAMTDETELLEENTFLRALVLEMRKEHNRLIAAMDRDEPWDEDELSYEAQSFLERELERRKLTPFGTRLGTLDTLK